MRKKPHVVFGGELAKVLTVENLQKLASGKPVKSWWCEKCSQEVYSLRCKCCGKSEEEKS